jgi:hypothetical protein
MAEHVESGFRVYAAALEVPSDSGFFAAVVVRKMDQAGAVQAQEVFRDERLEGGQVWRHPSEALDFALLVGRAAIRAQTVMSVMAAGPTSASAAVAA